MFAASAASILHVILPAEPLRLRTLPRERAGACGVHACEFAASRAAASAGSDRAAKPRQRAGARHTARAVGRPRLSTDRLQRTHAVAALPPRA